MYKILITFVVNIGHFSRHLLQLITFVVNIDNFSRRLLNIHILVDIYEILITL